MTATSDYLNQPIRSEAEARAAKRECNPNYTYRMTFAPGLFVGPEIEVEVETRVVGRHYPNLEIEAVWLDAWKMEGRAIKELGSVDLLKSDVPYLYELGHAIVEAAGLDDDWMAEQMGWHGYTLITRGTNDPDARWHRQQPEWED